MRDVATILWHFARARRLQRMLSARGREGLLEWQARSFDRFSQSVLAKSPFYRPLVGRPLQDFPVIGKPTFMDRFDDINTVGAKREESLELALRAERERDFSPTLNGVTVGLSSGTSGRRGVFLVSRPERLKWAGVMLAKALPGSILRKWRIAFFLRANSNLYGTLASSRRIAFDFYDLTRGHAHGLRRLETTRPDILTAPASVLRHLAELRLCGRLSISPRAVFSVAEVLDPSDERAISEAFGVPVRQIYQCTEGFLGISDGQGGICLNEEYVIVEREWVDRASGRFIPIITDFTRVSQPVIRYRLDDVLVERKDSVGPFTRLSAVEGRCDDVCTLVGDDGSEVLVFADALRQAVTSSGIPYADWRLVQSHPGQFEVQLLGAEDTQGLIERNLRNMARSMGCRPPEVTSPPFEFRDPGAKTRRIERRHG